MSVEAHYLLRRSEQALAFRDLDEVALVRDVRAHGGYPVPRDTEGTVVGVHEGGTAFVIEFAEPEGTLATVAAGDLRLVRSFAG